MRTASCTLWLHKLILTCRKCLAIASYSGYGYICIYGGNNNHCTHGCICMTDSIKNVKRKVGTGAAVTGPDVEPAVAPTAGSVVQVLAADRMVTASSPSPSPPAGLAAGV